MTAPMFYNFSGLTEDDALQVAKDKRAEALAKLEAAQTEFHEWDVVHRRLLAARANKFCDRPASEAHKEGRE